MAKIQKDWSKIKISLKNPRFTGESKKRLGVAPKYNQWQKWIKLIKFWQNQRRINEFITNDRIKNIKLKNYKNKIIQII